MDTGIDFDRSHVHVDAGQEAPLVLNVVVLAELLVASAPGNERGAIEAVERAVAGLGLPWPRLERLKTAVGEATMNAMEHGNEYRTDEHGHTLELVLHLKETGHDGQ